MNRPSKNRIFTLLSLKKLPLDDSFTGGLGLPFQNMAIGRFKKSFFLALFAVICISPALYAQTPVLATSTSPSVPAPDLLTLKETGHNFGKIPQGRPAIYIFEITNIGKDPLKLDNVQASCGCTTPEWSRDPIPPGSTANIKVGYNAYAEGVFNKTVTIFYHGNQTKMITISGEVYKSPPTSAPENSSVQFLKQTNQ